VVYAALIGFLIYKQLNFKILPSILISAAKTTASLSFIIVCASLFAWTLSIGKVPEIMTESLLNISNSFVGFIGSDLDPETSFLVRKIFVLIVLNISLLLVGMFIDAGPGLLIVVPVVLPVSAAIGMDSDLAAVHFGVMVVSNMVIGLVTPPVGSTLFVASAVGKVGILAMTPYVLRFLLVMILVQLLITFVPAITTWLPSLM
jgi:C4-dicarboxylate transporter DctM subunit